MNSVVVNVAYILVVVVIGWLPFLEALDSCYASQHNSIECDLLSGYDSYQHVKCLRREDILTLSRDTYDCSASHCWYPDCQLTLTDLAIQPVRQQCRCDQATRDDCKNAIHYNKRRCIKLPQYTSWQWATCKKSQELAMKPFSSSCPYPQTHCWYPCQSAIHGENSGKVSDDCHCSGASRLMTSSTGGFTVYIFALLTSVYMWYR